MKTILLILVLLVILASCSEKNYSPPQLLVHHPLQDIGSIKFDSVYHLTYVVENSGQQELVIDTITSSCGCSLPFVSKKNIQPSDTTLITVTYKPVDKGRFQKSLVIKSNTDSVFSVLSFKGEAI